MGPNVEEDMPMKEEKSLSLKESDNSKEKTCEIIKEFVEDEKETEEVLEKGNEESEDITKESLEVNSVEISMNIENMNRAVKEQCKSLNFDETHIEDESKK